MADNVIAVAEHNSLREQYGAAHKPLRKPTSKSVNRTSRRVKCGLLLHASLPVTVDPTADDANVCRRCYPKKATRG